MSRTYREYLKTMEFIKRELYKKIFRACFEQGLLNQLEEKPVGIIASDLNDDEYGRKMSRWLKELAKVQLLTSSESVPLSYKMSKQITMLYMANAGYERVSFDTGIYTGINDVFLDDTMSLDELLGNEKAKNKYLEENGKNLREKQDKGPVAVYDDYEVYIGKDEKVKVKTIIFDDYEFYTTEQNSEELGKNKIQLKDIKELVSTEIAL